MTQPSSGNRTTPTTRRRADAAQVLSSVADVPVIPATHVLRDYALLADGHRGVLVGPQGDCAWLCFPGWSDAAVFASLVGSGGHYLIQPRGRWVWGGYYEDGTLIWNSRWVTESGIFESREALCYPATHDRAVYSVAYQPLTPTASFSLPLTHGRTTAGTRWVLGNCEPIAGSTAIRTCRLGGGVPQMPCRELSIIIAVSSFSSSSKR